eukprot:GHVR01050245.1.p1 GENE.GHVR01050245.1~~GHVR01050245.1.p1  ORF type:complete len:215 (+),score=53.59 GHVR01050245.1:67-711(+)
MTDNLSDTLVSCGFSSESAWGDSYWTGLKFSNSKFNINRKYSAASVDICLSSLTTAEAKYPPQWLLNFTEQELEESQRIAYEWRNETKSSILSAWIAYRDNALGKNEILPISGHYIDGPLLSPTFPIEALDTLLLVGYEVEFDTCVKSLADTHIYYNDTQITHTYNTEQIIQKSFFEFVIRIIGGVCVCVLMYMCVCVFICGECMCIYINIRVY